MRPLGACELKADVTAFGDLPPGSRNAVEGLDQVDAASRQNWQSQPSWPNP